MCTSHTLWQKLQSQQTIDSWYQMEESRILAPDSFPAFSSVVTSAFAQYNFWKVAEENYFFDIFSLE